MKAVEKREKRKKEHKQHEQLHPARPWSSFHPASLHWEGCSWWAPLPVYGGCGSLHWWTYILNRGSTAVGGGSIMGKGRLVN